MRKNIEIIGGSVFTDKTKSALGILESKASDYYSFVRSHVGIIRFHTKTGMDVGVPPTINIAPKTLHSATEWLASVYVHEACHAYLYAIKAEHTGLAAEQYCNRHQLSSLRRMKAPEYIIKHMTGQTGSHFDLNGDGVYDSKDYRMRNY